MQIACSIIDIVNGAATGLGWIFRPVKSDTSVASGSPSLRHFFGVRSCAAQALDGLRHSLHSSASHGEYNQGLIFDTHC